MPNRVAQLESTVSQLQATVDGLRAELVDANERIRALEQEHESEETDNATMPHRSRTTNEETADADTPRSSLEDIIVA